MAFLGMRGTGNWVANQRPENWREMILYLYPNGKVPLTAMLAMLKSESTNDPKYNWWTKTLPKQLADVTGIYTNTGLSVAYTGAPLATSGTILYVKMSAVQASEFRDGHTVILTKKGDHAFDTFGSVEVRVINGADSYLGVRLEEADTANLSTANFVYIVGNANAEGAEIPDSVAYDPVQYTNVTQIFRTPLSLTRTAIKTKLRTGDAYQEAKREALELHAIEMEKSFLMSKMTERVVNGKPRRTTMGMIPFIEAYAPAENINAYTANVDYTGDTWLQGGETWMDERLEQIFRFGNSEKMAFCGTGALRGLNRLAKQTGELQLRVMDAAYGMKVVEWVTPTGTVYLKTHPLFSYNPQYNNSIVMFDLDKLGYRYIDDTFFKADKSDRENTNNSRDGKEEEFLTECGFEADHPETMGILHGVGLDNTLT